GVGGRAGNGVQRRGSRYAATLREGRGLHRQGRAPATPRRGAGGHPLHAHRRGQHLAVQRGEALHAGPGADSHPGGTTYRRPQGPERLRDERGLRAVGWEARAAGLPAAGARRRRERAARPVHGRALPGHGRSQGQWLFVRSGKLAGSQLNVLVCIKRVPETGARITLTADAQAIDTSLLGFTISPHEECAVEEALRITETHGGATTVMTLGGPAAREQLQN